MWYASCSVAPQLIPSTVPVCVVLAGAISVPCWIGTPSNPICVALEAVAEEVVGVLDAAGADEALLLEELPHPASTRTASSDGTIRRRGRMAGVNGSG